ncbi:YciI family protein [Chitinolyticbacter meiyuanensis]|uniref:YciI family protein n=1 Tax=Chitinolyticbacter meiyuanensis TaxID=682798 RepID=UPI0011E596E6|nr:YciI family protein [Chitinolyticbacter meiyuanensis]
MDFLLIIAHDDAFEPSAELIGEVHRWVADTTAAGIRRYGNPLASMQEAVTVRVRDGAVHATPGPFAAGDEQICAYDLISCASREEAVAVASRHPIARVAAIEVRPIWQSLANQGAA